MRSASLLKGASLSKVVDPAVKIPRFAYQLRFVREVILDGIRDKLCRIDCTEPAMTFLYASAE
jgi:hypothetical protein